MADLLPNPGLGGEVDFWQQQQRWSLRVPSIDWNNDEEFFGHMFFLALFVAFFRFHPLVLRGVWLVRTKMVSWFHSYWREISRFLPCSLFVLLCVVCAPPPSWPTAFVKSSSVGQGLFSSTNVSENIWKQKMTACAHMWQRHLRFDWDWCPSMPSAVAKNEHQVFEGSVTHAKSRHEPLEHWRYSSQLVNPTSPALPLGHPQHCPYPVKAMKNLLAWTCLIRKLNKKNTSSSAHRLIASHPHLILQFSDTRVLLWDSVLPSHRHPRCPRRAPRWVAWGVARRAAAHAAPCTGGHLRCDVTGHNVTVFQSHKWDGNICEKNL